MSAAWEIREASESDVQLVAQATGLSPISARILVARGINTAEKAEKFLSPGLARDWRDPYLIADLKKGIERIAAAIAAGQRIAIFGDYDLDGISSTALLTRALRDVGATVFPFVPLRFGEGYGLSEAAIKRMLKISPELVITVDCGVSCAYEVDMLLAQGVDVVITDHHEPTGDVPQGVAVIDPKLGEAQPSRHLAGAGVALKVVQAIFDRLGKKDDAWREYADLAMLGTVADLMPLRGENRALVSEGIALLNSSPRVGISSLCSVCNTTPTEVTANSLSFTLIPRFNAAGRMGDPTPALDLLLTDDPAEADRLASILDDCNTERKSVEKDLSEVAFKQAKQGKEDSRVIVVAGEGWHEGIRGIVASQLAGKYALPSFVLSVNDGIAQGSGRSSGKIDLFAAIETVSDLFIRYGGHKAAVGVTLKEEDVPAFEQRLNEYFKTYDASMFIARPVIDQVIDLKDLTFDLLSEIDTLGPFGQGNPKPLFALENVLLANRMRIGGEKEHLKFMAYDGATEISSIAFRCKNVEEIERHEAATDLIIEPVIDTWKGIKRLQLYVRKILPHTTQACEDSSAQLVEGLFSEDRGESSCGSASLTADSSPQTCREKLATLPSDDLEQCVCEAILGKGAHLHAAQQQALASLQEGESPLVVMATGRGKSAIFHIHAAMLALQHNKASVFVFPLRALANDQLFHLQQSFATLGLSVAVVAGETSEEARDQAFESLKNKTLDVVLTTPEFLSIHRNRFANTGQISFLVIDEAHHIGQASENHRPAYKEFGAICECLGHPSVLALTATADEKTAQALRELLGIEKHIFDRSVRENLRIVDQRRKKDRDSYLAACIARGGRSIVYVNSRADSVKLARALRKRIPHRAHRIAYYNADLTRDVRLAIEHAFRSGELDAVVATSAFGEGVNIRDITDIYLYHVPFNRVAFNQISGRAGRNGEEATIHLLFDYNDAELNERILFSRLPGREDMATVYRVLQDLKEEERGTLCACTDELACACSVKSPRFALDGEGIVNALRIFGELDLIDFAPGDDKHTITLHSNSRKANLEDSARYAEGICEKEEFQQFRQWVYSASADELLQGINAPILPHT